MHMCRGCDQPASRRCSGCTVPSAWYCGETCQRELWVLHIFECNPRKPINTAYHLARAVYKDRFPEDPQTCEDYGFSRALRADDSTNLFGLYIGLIKVHGVEPKTIHRWRLQGNLIEEIKTIFEELPQDRQGYYYRWFLENQWVLDRTHAAPDPLPHLLAPGWKYAGRSGSPNVVEIKATWPETKRDCLELCSSLLVKRHPSPMQPIWLTFGFCVCQEDSETLLAQLYLQLMEKCSFDELYAAYDSSSLVALFYSKGLRAEFDNIPHLGDILEGSPTWNKSIWDLKQFVGTENGKLIATVGADYGFFNCKNGVETAQLKDVYHQFFKHREADPMKLHEAALGGKTFDYIESLVKLKNDRKTIQRLMENPGSKGPSIPSEAKLGQSIWSVWDLKRFIVENGDLIPSIGVDYGFFNCQNGVETAQLKNVYRQFFQHPEANPIKLHQAAVGGKTLEYVESLVKLNKNEQKTLQRLMKNPYPLPKFDF